MAELAPKHQDQLERIKKNIEKSHSYFRANYDRWHKNKKFLYVTSINDKEMAVLKDLKKPQIEFNILEAFVSRQKGEFAKFEPGIKVSAGDDDAVDPATIDMVEGHFRKIEKNMRDESVSSGLYDDMLSGSFSVAKVWTEYTSDMSFDQVIKVGRAFDPTLCGFDPLARQSHKGDGEYQFEIFPKRESVFKDENPGVDTTQLTFSTNIDEFSWSYKTSKEKIILVAEYFEKKKKKTKIVKLSNKQTMTIDDFDKFLIKWEESGNTDQVPYIIAERSTVLTRIVRYKFIENKVISYKETNHCYLPLVFFDGDSVTLRQTSGGQMEQITRPYCYQATGVQRLKNFSGQTLANEIENMVQHKFMIPKEGIPQEYADAYTDVQVPNTIVYNNFKDDNPDIRLDPPREVQRVPTPPEILGAFMGADQTTQAILGNYDAALGINKNQLSGLAIIEGATQSNAAAMPFIVSYLAGLNQVALIVLDLIPKYIITPRNIPIIDKDGKQKFSRVNDAGSPSLQYNSNALNISVSAGVNFSVQKSRALTQIIAMMQASQEVAAFMNGPGLPVLLDNLEIRGADKLKTMAEEYLQQKQQQQAKLEQQAMQNDPRMQKIQLDKQKLAQDAQNDERKNQIDVAQVAVSNKNADTQRMKVMSDAGQSESNRELEQSKVLAEDARTAVESVIKAADAHHRGADMKHRHAKEAMELAHKFGAATSTDQNNTEDY